MPKYNVIGWYAADPHNPASEAYSLVVRVTAKDRREAFAKGEERLCQVALKPENLLNWFVKARR